MRMSMIVSVCVSLFVVVVVIMIVPMIVSVSSQDKKAKQVGEEAGAAHDEDQFGVVDFGRFDEARQSLKDDGDAKRDQEDGIEEGTEDLGSNPLRERESQLQFGRVRFARGRLLTPKVNSSVVAFCEAMTAQSPIASEMISFSYSQ